jgi:hypothetical protein
MSDAFGIHVNKKIVLASMKGLEGYNFNIPVCEEFHIQLKVPNRDLKEGRPVMVNHSSCLVLSCSIANQLDDFNPAHMHFFGENAFSVAYQKPNDAYITEDIPKLCARLSGTLLRHINDLNSNDIEKATSSANHFRGLFDHGNYKIDTADANTYKEKFTTIFRSAMPKELEEKVRTVSRKISGADGISDMIKHTLNSFLTRQSIRGLTEINAGRYPNVVKWITSQSFSIIALSPYGMPNINYVFLLTFPGRHASVKEPGFNIKEKKPVASQAPSSAKTPVYTTLSMLSPDLEEELRGM